MPLMKHSLLFYSPQLYSFKIRVLPIFQAPACCLDVCMQKSILRSVIAFVFVGDDLKNENEEKLN